MKNKNIYYRIFGFILLIILSLPIMYYIKSTGVINGADIYGHLYKTDSLYKSICNGNFFVLYDEQWYNGIQMFRYWPPLSYYYLALLQYLTGGNVETAYILLVGTTFVLGGFPWLLIGATEKKYKLGIAISILYWFLPDNLRIFFCEGNLPRILFVALLPYLLFFIWKFIRYKRKYYIIPIILLSFIFISIHLMMSAIIGIGITLFLFLYFVINKEFKFPFFSMLGIICGYALGGIILLPGLVGGIMTQNSSSSISTIGDWSQELTKSLNPFLRFNEPTIYYFGLSILIGIIILIRLSIIRKNKIILPSLLTALFIMISTSSSLTPYVELLPLSQVWWMERFTVVATSLFVLSLFLLKKEDTNNITYIFIVLILIIDLIPSLKMTGIPSSMTLKENQAKYDEIHLYDVAQEITNNRLSIIDESAFGSYESYFIKNNNINISTGWSLQGAQTYLNIVYLNEALMCNSYSYLFDRLINLGSDTVIIKKSALDVSEYEELINIGKKYNYELIAENDICFLFKLKDVNFKFGVINDYKYLAIGNSARYISLIYPEFENSSRMYLDDFSIDELLKYEKIYLSGDFYKNKSNAEFIVKELANNGIKVYIDINRIKQDFQGYQTFLDVSCRSLALLNSFPNITFEGKEYEINYDMNETWNASYITRVEENDEKFLYSGQKYSYFRKNNNITYIGMNLVYFYNQYKNDNLKYVLDNIFEMEEESYIKTKKIVPLEMDINYKNNTITINSNFNNLNTTISYQDFFYSNNHFYDKDNLLVVDKGTTIINFTYKYFKEGMIISIVGFILSLSLVIVTLKTKENINESK